MISDRTAQEMAIAAAKKKRTPVSVTAASATVQTVSSSPSFTIKEHHFRDLRVCLDSSAGKTWFTEQSSKFTAEDISNLCHQNESVLRTAWEIKTFQESLSTLIPNLSVDTLERILTFAENRIVSPLIDIENKLITRVLEKLILQMQDNEGV
jgi:hypothetical protein